MSNYSEDYKIIPLSNETLNDAISLVKNVFPYKPDQKNAKWNFTDSLSKPNSGENYWVAVTKDREVVGITGLYHDTYDKNIAWLGWFGVHPQHQRHGIGSKLLEFTIAKSVKRGFSILKLYTSSDQNEIAAHKLYKKHGFLKSAVDKKKDRIYFVKYLTNLSKKVMENGMKAYEIKIEWEGSFTVNEVIEKMNDSGKEPDWDGNDYGLYQIYGKHILCGQNTLLYIGMTTERSFSQRFKEHKMWLDEDQEEKNVKIYLGRIYNPDIHSEKNNWESWEEDVKLAEKILIYKYSPNYNSRELTRMPDLSPHKSIRLVHVGKRGRLEDEDNAPKDYSE